MQVRTVNPPPSGEPRAAGRPLGLADCGNCRSSRSAIAPHPAGTGTETVHQPCGQALPQIVEPAPDAELGEARSRLRIELDAAPQSHPAEALELVVLQCVEAAGVARLRNGAVEHARLRPRRVVQNGQHSAGARRQRRCSAHAMCPTASTRQACSRFPGSITQRAIRACCRCSPTETSSCSGSQSPRWFPFAPTELIKQTDRYKAVTPLIGPGSPRRKALSRPSS